MKIKDIRWYPAAFLLLPLLLCGVSAHGVQTSMISKMGVNQGSPTVDKNILPQIPHKDDASQQNPTLIQQNLESFNRPEGIESLVPKFNRKQQFETSYGRTFGQYGSYKKHKSWNRAVAQDRRRHGLAPKDFKTKFPWLVNKLHLPSVHGFGLNGFWNSYALPEGTPDVKGLGPSKFGQ